MLTPNDRETLHYARVSIASGQNHFICVALTDIEDHNEHLRKSCRKLRAYIRRKLEGAWCLEAWQRNNGIESGIRAGNDTAARLAWIDWMLEG